MLGAASGSGVEFAPSGRAPYVFVAADGQLLPLPEVAVGSGADNRALTDASSAQSLTQSDIADLRSEGTSGSGIIAALVGGSATFSGKTAFSQEKWLKRKTMKYMPRFRVVRTTPLNVAETALLKHADKVGGLRFDALAQLLMQGDVRAGRVPLVFDEVGGLLLGAVAHRMGGRGTLIAPQPSGPPNMSYIAKFNLGDVASASSSGVDGGSSSSSTSCAGDDGGGAAAAATASSSGAAASAGAPPRAHTAPASGLRVVGVPYATLAAWARDGPAIVLRLLAPPTVAAAATTAAGGEETPATAAATVPAVAVGEAPLESDPAAAADHCDNGAEDAAVEEDAGDDAAAAVDGSGDDAATSAVSASSASAASAVGKGSSRKRQRGDDKNAAAAAAPRSPHHLRPYSCPAEQQQRLLFSGADSCLVAMRGDPLPALLAAARFLRPGAPFAAFCTEMPPLSAAAASLRAAGIAVNVSLSETWTREYQVLPMRTHPEMSMHGASGFMLAGTIAHSAYSVVSGEVAPPW